MEITDRATLTHYDRSFSALPRTWRFETFVGSFVRIIGATLRYAYRDAWDRKNVIPNSELFEVNTGSDPKKDPICATDAQELAKSGQQTKTRSSCLRGMKWCRVQTHPTDPYVQNTPQCWGKSRQWLMVEVTSSAYISLDSTPSADTPPPGMLWRSSFDLLQIEPPFFLFFGMRGGEPRETANSDGIDPFARSSALLEIVGETRTLLPYSLTFSIKFQEMYHIISC